MRVKSFLVLGLFAVSVGCMVLGARAEDVPVAKAEEPVTKTEKKTENPKIRIGVYDNRAIACAYAPSEFNPVAEKMKEYEKAKAEGDEKRCAELKEWGATHQRQLHRQGFCAMPVDDLLVYVKDGLAELAQKENLALIVWRYDYASENVEVIDVTDQIVALYHPTEKTLKIVEEIQKHPPISLDILEKQGHDH